MSRARGVVARALLAFIHGYQGLRAGRPSPCRYWPTCSEYAVEAIERFGAGRGSWLAARRIGRCHPWGGKGIDLVPEVGTRSGSGPAGSAAGSAGSAGSAA